MTLKTLFAIPIIIILLVTLALASMIAGQGWSGQERGKAAVEAVENMRLLLQLQNDLRSERRGINLALGKQLPIPEPVLAQLAAARRSTGQRIAAIAERLRAVGKGSNAEAPDQYLVTVLARLATARGGVDQLLARPRNERTIAALAAIHPALVLVSQALEQPIERVCVEVTLADPTLAGLLTQERLATSLRDQVGLIASVTMPKVNNGEQLTEHDQETIRVMVGQASTLIRSLRDTIEIAGATDAMRAALTDLELVDRASIMAPLTEPGPMGAPTRSWAAEDNTDYPFPQRVLVGWGEKINVLRMAIVDSVVSRVTDRQRTREREFDLVMTGFGLVVIALLEAMLLLGRRVVSPLAQLGIAITRIAAGNRNVPLEMRSGTREITDMVAALETLRQAALVADATEMRQRIAARQRLLLLREALCIAQTVQEPARALEHDTACLSEGIDATIALVSTATATPPRTLSAAAAAVRLGLEEMRGSAAGLDATFAAANDAQTEDRPQDEFIAHIRAVQAEVDRRDVAVRAFIQPSLLALRDAAASTGASAPVLRDLVSDQFHRIEMTVATVASMRDAMTRATSIVRDLPLEQTQMAA